ncbi:uncharacterized protein PAC_03534 [Phialocephala subalpina]|uniref:Uncharacterized protein n=1 Tax=Phialocephala subalpina TaxID=576137 RepID=A0A1L7WLL7_9HELO|nr:uncharacterized protein PAC_03534 [Phialocephala subalpina]
MFNIMPNSVAIWYLWVHLVLLAAASNPSVYVPSSVTTVSPQVFSAEESKVTEAPERNRRQISTNYCTEWSYSNQSPVGCTAPNTCLFTTVSSTFALAYCGVAGSSYLYATACSDYSALTTNPSYETLHCPSAFPYCQSLNFVSDASDTYTMYGCDTWKATSVGVAYPLAGVAITTQALTSSGAAQKTTPTSTGTDIQSAISTLVSTSTSPSTVPVSTSSVPSGVNTAAAIGGALGGFASVVVAVLAVYKFWSKNRKSKEPLNP